MSNKLWYKDMLKLQILLVGNKIRNAYLDDCDLINNTIDDEIESLMDYYELVKYKRFIVHIDKIELLDSIILNSENIGKILGYVNYTHLSEKILRIRFRKSSLMNEVAFQMKCDDCIIFTEIAMIDFDNFNMDNMITHMQELEEMYKKVLFQYGYKNIQYQVLYHEKMYDNDELYKLSIDKVPIEKRIKFED